MAKNTQWLKQSMYVCGRALWRVWSLWWVAVFVAPPCDTPAANNHRRLNRMRLKGSVRVVAELNFIPLPSTLFSLQFCFSFWVSHPSKNAILRSFEGHFLPKLRWWHCQSESYCEDIAPKSAYLSILISYEFYWRINFLKSFKVCILADLLGEW